MALVWEKRAANTLPEILTSWKALGDDGNRPRAAPSFMVPAEEIIASGLGICHWTAVSRLPSPDGRIGWKRVRMSWPALRWTSPALPPMTAPAQSRPRFLLQPFASSFASAIGLRALTPAAQIQTWSPVLTSPS